MVRIPTPIPRSAAASVKRILMGPVLEVAWRLLVIVLFVALIVALVSIGGFLGPFLAAAILAAFISDDVRAFVRDVWRRDFWVFRT